MASSASAAASGLPSAALPAAAGATSAAGARPLEGLRIACIGSGYVGGPTMAMIAAKCPMVTVTVLDLWKERIDAWNSDALPIYEPGLKELVMATRGRNLFFTTEIDANIEAADIIFVAVNTPTKTSGVGAGRAADVKNIELAGRSIARVATTPKVVVEKSTVPLKTGEALRRVLDANGRGLAHTVLSNPEFLAEGTAVRDLERPSRVLIGGDAAAGGGLSAATALLVNLYAEWVPREKILTTNLWSSELSKLVANAFLAQRISSINSISALCEATSADVDEVARAVGSDTRIGPHFLKASVGFGGSCFKKDVLNLAYLCETQGLAKVADYWTSVIELNDWQQERFAAKVVSTMFNTITHKRIALLGFAFKKDTGDVRESAAAYVTKSLLAERAYLSVYDPAVSRVAMLTELEHTLGVSRSSDSELDKFLVTSESAVSALAGAHAALILTEWDEFKALDWAHVFSIMAKPAFVFDGRGILDHAALRAIGFEVYAIGKPIGGA